MPELTPDFQTIICMIDNRLDMLLDKHCGSGLLKDAMAYSLKAGGKRLRPLLCLLSAEIFGDMTKALDFACAIEMIHTYSLIHDDLPCMDNDVLRRGKPTNHVVFGEAQAVLAGDGLLNTAFEVMIAAAAENKELDALGAMRIIAGASGVRGMIDGQSADIEFEGKDVDIETLHYIHSRKTAALIKASVTSGAALMRASGAEIDALSLFGDNMGLVFQIVDDILDEEGNTATLGKTSGKDKASGKITFVRLYGIEESRRIAAQKTKEAADALSRFNGRADGLKLLAESMLTRKK